MGRFGNCIGSDNGGCVGSISDDTYCPSEGRPCILREAEKKDNLINKLTLFDTAEYRLRGAKKTSIYQHEPRKYRLELYEIYKDLSLDALKNLVRLRSLENYKNEE
jgi:hypothetical protein